MTSEPDLTEFERLSLRVRRVPCHLATARDKLSPEDRVLLDAACATPKSRILPSAIAEWLAARGQEVSTNAVSAHRRLKCGCYLR